jgi:hypothetical protein
VGKIAGLKIDEEVFLLNSEGKSRFFMAHRSAHDMPVRKLLGLLEGHASDASMPWERGMQPFDARFAGLRGEDSL